MNVTIGRKPEVTRGPQKVGTLHTGAGSGKAYLVVANRGKGKKLLIDLEDSAVVMEVYDDRAFGNYSLNPIAKGTQVTLSEEVV
jgi:hypothetical protein